MALEKSTFVHSFPGGSFETVGKQVDEFIAKLGGQWDISVEYHYDAYPLFDKKVVNITAVVEIVQYTGNSYTI